MRAVTAQASPRWPWRSAAAAAIAADAAPTSCIACHSNADLFDTESVAMVAGYAQDVHASVGLSCHDCHGGNPDPALAEDLDAAMSADWAANPYRGEWTAQDIPAACGRCHSDPEYMRRFRPDLRVDQETEYRTSHHVALAAGDQRVATCTSCHGVHDIKSISDPAARTYPTRVAETLRRLPLRRRAHDGIEDGRRPASSVNQQEPGRACTPRPSMAATCRRPPATTATASWCDAARRRVARFVCGQCHVRESQLFLQSPKFAALDVHNEFLAEKDVTAAAA